MKENIFMVSDEIEKELKIKTERKETDKDRIIKIFMEGKKMGKTELSINEVTAAYYNLYTAKEKGKKKIKDKKTITFLLCVLKGRSKDNGILARGEKRGMFKLRATQK